MPDFRKLLTEPNPSAAVTLLRALLRGLAIPYSAAIRLRNLMYTTGLKRTYRVEAPVVSIGNLSVGGTGKTPMVSLVCHTLREKGIRVAVLSRGYGQLDHGGNDEALELELLHPDVPHLQHPNRFASAKIAIEELDMQALVLDDGFQHRKLARDLDIVLIDATDSETAQTLLPGGLLREPFSALRRSHLIVLTRTDAARPDHLERIKARIAHVAPKVPMIDAVHRAVGLVTHSGRRDDALPVEDEPILAFCGIGNPTAFFQQLETLGFRLLDRRVFVDHHPYGLEDVRKLEQWATGFPDARRVVCTMKDLVKLQMDFLGRLPLHALQIRMDIVSGQDTWRTVWNDFVNRIAPPPPDNQNDADRDHAVSTT